VELTYITTKLLENKMLTPSSSKRFEKQTVNIIKLIKDSHNINIKKSPSVFYYY